MICERLTGSLQLEIWGGQYELYFFLQKNTECGVSNGWQEVRVNGYLKLGLCLPPEALVTVQGWTTTGDKWWGWWHVMWATRNQPFHSFIIIFRSGKGRDSRERYITRLFCPVIEDSSLWKNYKKHPEFESFISESTWYDGHGAGDCRKAAAWEGLETA